MFTSGKLALLSCAILAGGCTTLLDPYRVHEDSGLYGTKDCSVADDERTELSKAFVTSYRLQCAYIGAAGDQALARNVASTGLMAGAAYAGLLGISDGIAPANADNQIAAIASLSALGLGWTSLFTSPQRQDVYIAGVEAISCVQRRSEPFNISEEELSTFVAAMDGSPSFRLLIAFVKSNRGNDELVAAAEDTLSDAEVLRSQLNGGAAADMKFALIKIDTAVMLEVRKTQPDLNAVKALSDGLPGLAKSLGQTLTVNPEPDSETIRTADADKTGKIEARADELRRRKAELETIIQKSKVDIASAGKVTDCGLETATLKLEAAPAKLEFKKGASGMAQIVAVNGEAPFSAYFLSNPAGLDIVHTSPFDRVFGIAASEATVAGTYTLLLVDKTGIPIQVPVEVKP